MKRGLLPFAYLAFALLSVSGEGAYKHSSVHTMPFDGVVTYYRPTDDYFFMKASDGSGTWRVQVRDKRDTALLKTGSMITIADGETRENSTTRRVLRATLKPWQSVADDEIPMPPHRALSVAELYTHPLNTPGAEDHWGELVSCVGVVRDINRRQSITQLQVGDGNLSFQAAARIGIDTPLPEDLKLGARVRVSGVMLYSPVDDPSHRSMSDFTDVSIMPMDIGGVEVISRAPFWTPARIWIVASMGFLLALVLFLWMRMERVRDEVAFDATHRERLRLSQDLHDDFQQLLAGTMFRIGAAQNKLGENDIPAAMEQLRSATQSLGYTQTQLRTVLWGLVEEAEGPASLSSLFRYAADRMAHWRGIVSIHSSGHEPRLARSVSGSLLMILKEAVGNALTHGFATKVDVSIEFAGRELTLSIRDNGVGFDTTRSVASGHYGLESMRERAAHIGGTLKIVSSPDNGTLVTATIPLQGES